MAANKHLIGDEPPSYKAATAPTYSESMPMTMPQSMPSSMSTTMNSPMSSSMPPTTNSPMLQPTTMLQQQPILQNESWHPSSQIPTCGQIPINYPQYISAALPKFGPMPVKLICPYCTTEITSIVKFEAGYKTHMIALILFVLCFVILAWLPYCINACKVQKHYCPNCNGYLGAYYKHRFHRYNKWTGNMEIIEM